MLGHRRFTEATRLAKERRAREDEAPRLAQMFPDLESLVIHVRESREYDGQPNVEAEHTRRVVVANAPALFDVRCSDRNCEGGGYSLTEEILAALRAKKTVSGGSRACAGVVSDAPCGRRLEYKLVATYASHLT